MKLDPSKMETRAAHHLQMSVIVPRPIAFVSTIGPDGVFDVAPFSSYMTVAIQPNIVAFSVSGRRGGEKKRTRANIESCKEFVLNLVTEEMAERMNKAAAKSLAKVDKFKAVGLTPLKSDVVKPPRVAESPVNMECRVRQIIEFGNAPNLTSLIIGEVVLVHVKDEFYANGEVLGSKLKAVGRLGGNAFCRTTDTFEMVRPD